MNYEHLTAKQTAALLSREPAIVVLDIRTADEFEMYYIAHAVNLDCQSEFFERRLKRLNKTAKYIVHCQSGGRSLPALETFKRLGFKNVVHMDGGLREWVGADLPVISNWSI